MPSAQSCLLPCLHRLCRSCALNVVPTEPPVPRKCLATVAGVVYCHSPFTADDILIPAVEPQGHPQQQQGQQQQWCNRCSSKKKQREATVLCRTCDNSPLCEVHGDDHDNDHDLAPLSSTAAAAGSSTRPAGDTCKHHGPQPLDFYCDRCDVFVCATCVTTSHEGHVFVAAKAGVGKQTGMLRDGLDAVRPKTELCESLLGKVAEETARLLAQKAKTVDQIKAQFDEYIVPLQRTVDALRARRLALCDELNTNVEADLKAVQLQQERLSLVRDHLTTASSLVNELVKDSSSSSSSAATSPQSQAYRVFLLARLRTLKDIDVSLPPVATVPWAFHFVPPKDVMAADVGQLGALVTGKPRDYKAIGAPVTFLGKSGAGRGEFSSPCGLAIDGAGNLVVAEHSGPKRVQTVTANAGRFVTETASHLQGSNVCDVAVLSGTGHLAVAHFLPTVSIVDGRTGTLIRDIGCTRSCGVTDMAEGKIAVHCGVKVEAYDVNTGKQLWVSTGRGFKHENFCGITYVPEAKVVACTDAARNAIQLLSAVDGSPVGFIEGSGINQPVGLCYDAASKVLIVTEWAGRSVSAWSYETRTLVHRWGTKDLGDAGSWGAAVSDKGVFVSDYRTGRIIVY